MFQKEFKAPVYTEQINQGSVQYRSPSNIALIKYWGKLKGQIPANPSISFTLDACATTTLLTYKKRNNNTNGFSFDLLFEGKPMETFKPKINTFLERINQYLPFLKDYHFVIETSNSFPHSSGIASSASGMSALAMCFMEIERKFCPEMDLTFFIQKASFLARLGSGSACRSLEGPLVQWGATKHINGSSDFFGIPYPYKINAVFNNFHDTILLVDKGEKQVSSTLGHELMNGHPYAEARFKQAHDHIDKLKDILESGNLVAFIQLVESEALTLHAMMMASKPYFILMKPHTLQIIQKIWAFRAQTKTHICFTLDAGANVHVLYPENEKEVIFPFIQKELVPFCQQHQYICDRVGFGAKKLIG